MHDNAEKYSADITVGGFETVYIDENKQIVSNVCESDTVYSKENKKDIMKKYLINSGTGMHSLWNKLFKRELIANNEILFDLKRNQGEDWDFILKAFIKADVIVLIPKPIYRYFVSESSGFLNQFEKYRGDIAYCVAMGKELSDSTKEIFDIRPEEYNFTETEVNYFFMIISVLEHYLKGSNFRKNIEPLMKSKGINKTIKTVFKINNNDLAQYSLSRRHKIAAFFLALKMPRTALRFYRK